LTATGSDVKLGLQVDYWKERDASKYTLKSNFKSFHVRRLPPIGEQTQAPGLWLDVVTKGKKIISTLFVVKISFPETFLLPYGTKWVKFFFFSSC